MGSESLDFATEFRRLATENRPESAVELGGVAIRLVRVAGGGEGRWDRHDSTAETAIVWSGDFSVEFRDSTVFLGPGQCCVIPSGGRTSRQVEERCRNHTVHHRGELNDASVLSSIRQQCVDVSGKARIRALLEPSSVTIPPTFLARADEVIE